MEVVAVKQRFSQTDLLTLTISHPFLCAGLYGFLLSWPSGGVQASGHHHSGEFGGLSDGINPSPPPCIGFSLLFFALGCVLSCEDTQRFFKLFFEPEKGEL